MPLFYIAKKICPLPVLPQLVDVALPKPPASLRNSSLGTLAPVLRRQALEGVAADPVFQVLDPPLGSNATGTNPPARPA
jgi:hypothetical protein